MTTTETIDLQLPEGRSVTVQIRRRGVEISPHTAHELQEIHGWVTTEDAETHRWLSVALRGIGEGTVRSGTPYSESGGRWRVSWNSYGESGGLHTYGLILREAEELSLESLIIDGIELHPYEYREEVLDNGLTIWAKMVGTRADVTRLNRLIRTHMTFPVIRRGITDTPRHMQLGVAEWADYEDRIKYRLVLVDRDITEGMRAELSHIQERNDRAAYGYYANLVDRLADLLVDKQVLTKAELDVLRDAAREQPGVARHQFWHVADVDAL
jgi:hypothetical protein